MNNYASQKMLMVKNPPANAGDAGLIPRLGRSPGVGLGLTGSELKNPPANAGDAGLILRLERSPRGENGNSLQYSCLGNPMDRRAWWAAVRGVAKSQTQLNN